MIYVNQEQLKQVEYLLAQAAQGNHVLFDTQVVREVFSRGGEPERESAQSEEESYGVEHLIERLISQPSLAQKRAYLERLDPPTFERVVRTYFNIVENNIFESLGEKH